MKRTLMQVYVKGSDKALAVYKEAFGAEVVAEYKHDDGTYMHAELFVHGQIIAVSEATEPMVVGNTMQFCLHYGEGHEAEIERAYAMLKVGGDVISPPGACSFSPLMACVIDRFGVNWCLFI